jgi:putative transposase
LRGDQLPAPRERFELNDHHKATIFACKGNVSLAYDELRRASHVLPTYSVFWRRWHEELKAHQAYARKGADGFTNHRMYLPFEAPHRNAVWQADHFELPIDVIADGCTTTLVKPWLTLFEDDRTRMDMGWALTATPHRRADAETVVATLASAIRVRLVDGIEVGGVPGAVRWDNDKSFTAGMVTQLAAAVGFEPHAVPPYSGYMKGKIERLGRTIEDGFCVLQPGFTHGPRTHTQKNPYRDTDPITADELRARLAIWMAEYRNRRHSTLCMSPFAAWDADSTPLRRARDEQLRSALLVDPRTRTVQKTGVFFRNRYWAPSNGNELVGRKVNVRYPIGPDLDFIELYLPDGRWAATAWPARQLTEAQRARVAEANRDDYGEARRLLDLATAMRTGANAAVGATDATPAVASMPVTDELAANSGDLYDLLNSDDTTTET